MNQDSRQRSGATRRRRSYDKIVTAAAQVLSSSPTATMEDVARSAGVSLATLYNHFPNKGALIEQVYGDMWAEIGEEAQAAFVRYLRRVFEVAHYKWGLPGFDQMRDVVQQHVYSNLAALQAEAINSENADRTQTFIEQLSSGR